MLVRLSLLLLPLSVVSSSLRTEKKTIQHPVVASTNDEPSVLAAVMEKLHYLEQQFETQKREFEVKFEAQNAQIQALEAKITFSTLSKIEGVLPKPNPFNDKIKDITHLVCLYQHH